MTKEITWECETHDDSGTFNRDTVPGAAQFFDNMLALLEGSGDPSCVVPDSVTLNYDGCENTTYRLAEAQR